MSRVRARTIAARSAATRAAAGRIVTSNWLGPYSRMNCSGSSPSRSIVPSRSSPNAAAARNPSNRERAAGQAPASRPARIPARRTPAGAGRRPRGAGRARPAGAFVCNRPSPAPSKSRTSPRTSRMSAPPSAPGTWHSVSMSGMMTRSPSDPYGPSPIVPKQVISALVGTQPTPDATHPANAFSGTALPRSLPARSVIPTNVRPGPVIVPPRRRYGRARHAGRPMRASALPTCPSLSR